MTGAGAASPAERLRAAVETEDASSVQAALRSYLTWFRSAPRSLREVADAKDLFEWAVATASSRKSRVAQELARVTTLLAGYGPCRISHTWHVDG